VSGHPEGVLGDPKGARNGGNHLCVRAVGHSHADRVCERGRGWGQGTGMGWGEWVVQARAREWVWEWVWRDDDIVAVATDRV
jgi:hypothetical protein